MATALQGGGKTRWSETAKETNKKTRRGATQRTHHNAAFLGHHQRWAHGFVKEEHAHLRSNSASNRKRKKEEGNRMRGGKKKKFKKEEEEKRKEKEEKEEDKG